MENKNKNQPRNFIFSSQFVLVTRNDGSEATLKKRTVTWMCEQGVEKQSNDRNKRFIRLVVHYNEIVQAVEKSHESW